MNAEDFLALLFFHFVAGLTYTIGILIICEYFADQDKHDK